MFCIELLLLRLLLVFYSPAVHPRLLFVVLFLLSLPLWQLVLLCPLPSAVQLSLLLLLLVSCGSTFSFPFLRLSLAAVVVVVRLCRTALQLSLRFTS